VNKRVNVANEEKRSAETAFVSYATTDRKEALAVCKAIERRGTRCWIACRDVGPGENYQEAIVRAIRTAGAMVLVFSDAANNSDEIKKELSLASKHHVPLIALRIEDVEPSDAFAYELSTRQWIDAFAGWDKSIDALVRSIRQTAEANTGEHSSKVPAVARPRGLPWRHLELFATAAALALPFVTAGAWWILRPAPAAAHSMTVRLSGFQVLSPDLSPTMPDAVRDEIITAFGDQGVVGVSTAPAPSPGPSPAYALGGTIRRDGAQIRVISRLTNERSGATLWSTSADYDAEQASRVPRRIAVDAGNTVHCGLFGLSTYPKPMPDRVISDYMQFCQLYWSETDAGKALVAARRVIAAAPDFSWGWSAVASAAADDLFVETSGPARDEVRKEGLQAADKALALDATNSEALAAKSGLIDPADWVGQEKLLKQSIAARPLDCGCEHFHYAVMLENVGRFTDSVAEARRSVDQLALYGGSQYLLAKSLNLVGKRDEAKPHIDAAIDLVPASDFADAVAVSQAPETGDYAAAIKALNDPKFQLPPPLRAALKAGFQAMASGDAAVKAQAVKILGSLPDDEKNYWVLKTLAALGAHHDASELFVNGINSRYDWISLLWYPSMRGVLNDPSFAALAQRLGLMTYWKTTHTRPDVCTANDAPPFCRLI
jgi:tetratricopeptide (TPR) repeat protein